MEGKGVDTTHIENEGALTIEQIATQRAEEAADLKAIPDFMRKKRNLPSSTSHGKAKSMVHAVGNESPGKHNSDKWVRSLYPTTSRGSKISSHSDNSLGVETNQVHMHHHAHLHITNKNGKNGKEGKNGKSSNSSGLDSIGLSENKSSGEISNESEKTQGSATTWAAIDTLDDVRKLAMETKDVDYFQEDQEKALNQMRQSHVRLLKLMKGRNSRLEKGELVSDRTSEVGKEDDTVNTAKTSNANKTKRGSHNFEELIPEPMDRINSVDEDGDAQHKKPIYVSDYLENLEDVELITSTECQYIEQMEQIIKDTDTL